MSTPDFTRMDVLFKTRVEFNDYMSSQQRALELRRYDERIAALKSARRTLESAPLFRLTKQETKSAETFCVSRGWTKEDAAFFVEDFQRRCPMADSKKMDKTRVASGMSSIASALMNG